MITAKSRSGFTLIELLVVIAIIAILAAILFPVLASAKLSAKRAQCASNVRQVGCAVILYAQDNDGCYPTTWRHDGSNIWALIARYIGKSNGGSHSNDVVAELNKCPSAIGKRQALSYNAFLYRNGKCLIKKTRLAIVAGDSGQVDWGGKNKAADFAAPHDFYAALYYAGLWKNSGSGNFGDPNETNLNRDATLFSQYGGKDLNAEPTDYWGLPVFRHGGVGNFAFADGHVAALKRENLTLQMIRINLQ